jgi:hypothetical protein
MKNHDELAKMLSAAARFRATELVNGKNFTREEVGLYIQNYSGKYSQQMVEAGIGVILMKRVTRDSLIQRAKRLFASPQKGDPIEQVEHMARQMADNPVFREAAIKLIQNNFRG